MRSLMTWVEPERECGYLPDRMASLDHRVLADVTPEELEPMLVRGWRRFGPVYFRPACQPCGECVSIRIPTAELLPTSSQRRARRRCARFRITLAKPRVDRERLDLYRAWHAAREEARGWEPNVLDAESYSRQFAFPHPAGFELTMHDGDRLLAVGLHDVTPAAWSAVYFFFDPAIANLSPGIANVMLAVELARARGIPHVYLGYRVMGCPSMRYKAGFRPHELLAGRPALEEAPRWERAAG